MDETTETVMQARKEKSMWVAFKRMDKKKFLLTRQIPEQLVSEPSGADFPEPVRKDVPTQPSAPQPSTTQHSAAECEPDSALSYV